MATQMKSDDIGRSHGELVELVGVKNRVSPEEWEVRVNLAACYRLVFHYGWHHLNLNHISARVPGEDDQILINPYGPIYNEITASNLVKIDLDGNVLDDTPYGINAAGYTIHSAIHAARHDVDCVLHTTLSPASPSRRSNAGCCRSIRMRCGSITGTVITTMKACRSNSVSANAWSPASAITAP